MSRFPPTLVVMLNVGVDDERQAEDQTHGIHANVNVQRCGFTDLSLGGGDSKQGKVHGCLGGEGKGGRGNGNGRGE